jgi:glycosyl transferase family 25
MKSAYTFAVALPRFEARYAHLRAQLSDHIGDQYEIVGVDGRELALSEAIAPEALAANMSRGQAGCALSHVAAYQRMVELDLPHAFVVEDDVVLPKDIDSVIAACLPHLSPRDVISLYSPRPRPTEYSDRGAPVLASGRLLAPVATLDTHTATAYLIGREAAAAIVECNVPVRHLADHWFAFHAAGAVERVLLHHPMPVSTAQFDSSIGYDRAIRGALKATVLALPPVRRLLQRQRTEAERRHKANIIVIDAPTFYDH